MRKRFEEIERQRSGRRRSVMRLAVPAGLCLAIAGCLNTPNVSSTPTAIAYQVEDTVYTHAVLFTPATVTYTPMEQLRLGDFVNGVRPERGDTVVLTAAGPLANARMQLVAEDLGSMGVLVAANQEVLTGGEAVTVSLRRQVYLPTACRPAGVPGISQGSMTPPLGCANATNLARMVADPQDLVRGRDTGPADGQAAVQAIARYRTDAVKPLQTFGGESVGGGE